MSDKSDLQSICDCMLSPPSLDPGNPRVIAYFSRIDTAASIFGIELASSSFGFSANIIKRNQCLEKIRECIDMYENISAAGLFMNENPFTRIDAINSSRRVVDDIGNSNEIFSSTMKNIRTLLDLITRRDAGSFDISGARPQVSALDISFGGMTGIPSSIFNADDLKRQQSLNALRELDFSKRKPKVLFVSEREGETYDIVVGWLKMRDASSYMLTLSDRVFQHTIHVTIQSQNLENVDETTKSFYKSVIAPVIGNSIKEKDVALYRFSNVLRDSVYSFSILPMQNINSGRNNLFRMTLNRVVMTDRQMSNILSAIQLAGFSNTDEITPYPFISKELYGTDKYGWLLAGVNLLSAFDKNEQAAKVRSYSYIGAKWSQISQLVLSGEFYAPSNVSSFEQALNNSFSTYGLSSTMIEILDKCGMLLFFDDREGFDTTIVSTGNSNAVKETGLARAIISAIDPVSATVTPSAIYAATEINSGNWRTLFASQVLTPRLDNSSDEIDIISYEGVTRFLNVMIDASRRAS